MSLSRQKKSIKWAVDNHKCRYCDQTGKVVDAIGIPLKTKTYDKDVYVWVSIPSMSGKSVYVRLHVLVGYLKYGDKILPSTMELDHTNDDKLDNSWSNITLRDRSTHHRKDSRMNTMYKVFDGARRFIAATKYLKDAYAIAEKRPNCFALKASGRIGRNSPKLKIDLSKYYKPAKRK